MESNCLVTTPIYYVNAKPHLGHLYTTIAADVFCRFNTMQGIESFLLTGTDEHGDKIAAAAKKNNITPQEYADKISATFRNLWPQFNVKPDYFIRTTFTEHKNTVTNILQKIYDQGDIYFNEYEGLYCFDCERFYQERELVNGLCPDHKTKLKTIREANYFFSMSKYQDWLIDYIKKNPDFLQPSQYKKEILSFLKEPLDDLCISRPKARLSWGITLPFDDNYVTYVWFDALLNYISALGYPDGNLFKKYWNNTHHIVAKDIIKPHGIYWPIILKAIGLPMYKSLHIHGYWNIDKNKMSKSLGNIIVPEELLKKYGTDAVRFSIMREMAFGFDTNFSEDLIIRRINSDLANNFGNLVSRTLSMTHKYFDGVVPEPCGLKEHIVLRDKAIEVVESFENNMEKFKFHKALISIGELIATMNKYIDEKAPWELAKNENDRDKLKSVIYGLLEGLRIVSGLIYPFMPQTSRNLQDYLGLDCYDIYYDIDCLKSWSILKPNLKVKKQTKLFPRIEV